MNKPPQTKLKNVVIVRNAYKWQYGGAEQFAYNLAVSFRAEGVNATVSTRVPELISHCKKDNIRTFKNIWFKNETHRQWILAYAVSFPVLIAQYVWLFLMSKADVVIFSSRDDQVFGTIAAKITGVPVVWFDHADMKHIVAHRSRFIGKAYYWAMRNADRVIMTSNAEHEKVTANLPESNQRNFVTIVNGAMKGSGVAMPKDLGIQVIAYAGRLDKDKGILDLVEAAKTLVEKIPNAQFWIGGKGPDEEIFVEKITSYGLTQNFRLLGHLSNVWDLLMTADIFVYPTHHDAAPLAPVEAMLAGVPVVASRIGGIPEMIPETAGILIPSNRPNALADAIIRILENADLAKSLRAGALKAGGIREFGYVTRVHYIPLIDEIMKERL